MTITTAPVLLDRRGKTITTFVVFDAAAALRELPEGHQLQLVTDDFEPLQARCRRMVRGRRASAGLVRARTGGAPVPHREGHPQGR
jgi:hypothetical protein